MQHLWSILSKKSVIDSMTNNISIMDVIDEVKVDLTLPKNLGEIKNIGIPVEFEITSLWYRETPNDELPFYFRIEFYDPSGNILNVFESPIAFQKDKKRLRSQSKIQGLPINDSGVYKFIINFKEKDTENYQKVAELPIDVIVNKTAGEEVPI